MPVRHAGRIVGVQRKAHAIQRVATKAVKEFHSLSQRLDAGDVEWFLAYSMKPTEHHKRLHMAISPGMQVRDDHVSCFGLCCSFLLYSLCIIHSQAF
jgi:hypothetical protein